MARDDNVREGKRKEGKRVMEQDGGEGGGEKGLCASGLASEGRRHSLQFPAPAKNVLLNSSSHNNFVKIYLLSVYCSVSLEFILLSYPETSKTLPFSPFIHAAAKKTSDFFPSFSPSSFLSFSHSPLKLHMYGTYGGLPHRSFPSLYT